MEPNEGPFKLVTPNPNKRQRLHERCHGLEQHEHLSDSRCLVVGELQLSPGVLVVRPGFGGPGLGVVRQDDGPPGSRVAHHGHLHGAHALAHPDQALAEREDAGVVVVQDGHRGDQRLHQTGLGGHADLVALKHPLRIADAQVEEAHKEVLVLLEYVVVDDADLQTQSHGRQTASP